MPMTFDKRADAFIEALPRLRQQLNEAEAAAANGEPIPRIDPLPPPPQTQMGALVSALTGIRRALERLANDGR